MNEQEKNEHMRRLLDSIADMPPPPLRPDQLEAMRSTEAQSLVPGQARMLNEDELRLRESLIAQQQGLRCVAPGSPLYDKVMGTNHHEEWAKVYAEARASHAAGEPLIRTVCKIAARILFVLLLVGVAVAVAVMV